MREDEGLRIKLIKTILEWEEKQLADLKRGIYHDFKVTTDGNRIGDMAYQENGQDKSILSVLELSDYLGVSTDCVYTMVREKQIPHVRIRRRILFHRHEIDLWIRENTIKS